MLLAFISSTLNVNTHNAQHTYTISAKQVFTMSVGDNSDNDLPSSEQKPDGDKFVTALLVLAEASRDQSKANEKQSKANEKQSATNARLASMLQATAGAQGYTFDSSNHLVTPNSERTQLPIDERSNLLSSAERSLPNQDLVTTSTTATTAQLLLNPPTIQRNTSAPDEDLHQSSAAAAAAPPPVAATDVPPPAAADMHQIVPSASAAPPPVAATDVPPPAASPGANVCCGKKTGHESEDERHEDIPPSIDADSSSCAKKSRVHQGLRSPPIDVESSSCAKKSRGDDPLRQSSFSAVAPPPPEYAAAISNEKRKRGTDTNGATPTKLAPIFTRVTKKQKKNTADDSGGDGGGDKVLKSGGDEPCGHQGDSGGDGGGDEVLKSGGDEPCGSQAKFIKKGKKFVPLIKLCITCQFKYRTSAVEGGKHCITCGRNQGLEITPKKPCSALSCNSLALKRGYCKQHKSMIESDRQNRVNAANAFFESDSIQLPTRFDVNVHDLSMLQQLPPPGFDTLFEHFQQCVAAFEEYKSEGNCQKANNAYNACKDKWEGVTFPHPPHKYVPPPQIDVVNTLSGPSRVQPVNGYGNAVGGHPSGFICRSGTPTGEDVLHAAAAVGCRFGDLSMYAYLPPEVYRKHGYHLKSNQIEIAMSNGVIFRGTVDLPSNELCISCSGISERDAQEIKLDSYQRSPVGAANVHTLIAAAFGLDLESTGGIDHLNRKRSDNRVVNLHSATSKEQTTNRTCVISYYN